ncbi:MAG: phosphoglycolate phosphatase [Pseudomonadota bacterium]
MSLAMPALAVQKLKVSAILIDLDGTLVHSAPELARAAGRMLVDLGMPALAQAQIESYIGEGAAVLIKRCLTGELDGEPDAALYAKAHDLFFKYYAQNAAESRPYPNVVAGVQALKQAGYRLACVTNKPESFTMPLLAANDLLQYFELVVSGDTLPKKKPDPDQIFYICEKLGVAVADTLLIGDSKTDVAAASNAGCYIFTIPYGYNQGQKIEVSAVNALINNIGDALDFIERI